MKKLLIIFLNISLLTISTSSCAMSSDKKQKPLEPPISVPFDITKKDNEVELLIKIKEENGYVFELKFAYDDPRRSKYEWVEILKSFFPEKPYTKEERVDLERVRKLVGSEELENGQWVKHSGITVPIHLTVTKLEEDGSKIVVFDKIKEPEEARAGYYFHKEIKGMALEPGIYRAIVKTTKDSPEFIGTRIRLVFTISGSGKP